MSIIQTANELSESFLPAFALIKGPAQSGDGGYPPLGIQWTLSKLGVPSLRLDEGAETVGRFRVVCQASGSMNAQGEPPAVGGDGSYSLTQIAIGAGELAVTDTRLVVILSKARSLVGKVDVSRGSILALVMPLADVEIVSVRRATGIFGRTKDNRTTIESMSKLAVIMIEACKDAVDDQHSTSQESIYQRISSVVVETAARTRLATTEPNGEERDILERALSGERYEEDDETIARLVM